MKHEETTRNTRMMLAASLKKFMAKKPLSKITVSEIIADCGVNRKTFYYHFEDVYALMKWMLEEEAIAVVKQFDLMVDYEDAISFIMEYVRANKHLLACAYDSMGRDEMKRFFYRDFVGIVQKVIEDTQQQLDMQVEENFKCFLVHFYTEAVAGLLIDEFTEEEHDSKQAVEYVSLIIKNSLPEVLKAAAEKKY